MTTHPCRHVCHLDAGDLTASQLSLLQLAQVRDVAAQTGTSTHIDAMILCAFDYLHALGRSTVSPLAASLGDRFTITAAGLAWLRGRDQDDDWQCPCRLCAGKG